jgi:hypothetical protein
MARSEWMQRWWKVMVGISAATVFASSCSTEQVARVAAGVEAALNYESDGDDISFGDWLQDEIEDW